jgi:hypothetical protein
LEALFKGGQGSTSGCCAIEEEEDVIKYIFFNCHESRNIMEKIYLMGLYKN